MSTNVITLVLYSRVHHDPLLAGFDQERRLRRREAGKEDAGEKTVRDGRGTKGKNILISCHLKCDFCLSITERHIISCIHR